MRDPSARNRQIFEYILEEPSSLYRIHTRSDIGSGTISKVLKGLKRNEYIRSYKPLKKKANVEKDEKSKKGKLVRNLWGPTIAGIKEICFFEESVMKKLDTIYEYWLDYPEFLEDLKLHGFDLNLIKNESSKAKGIFQKYIQLCVDKRKQIIDFLNNPGTYDFITRDNIGEFLLVQRNPEYKKILLELYKYMPGVQNTVNSLFDSFGLEYKKLKKLGK